MVLELISDSEFASLPEEPAQKFVALEQICRRNLEEVETGDFNGSQGRQARMEYMAIVAAAAEELGVGGLGYPDGAEEPHQEIDSFLVRARAATTRLKLRSSGAAHPYSVRLGAGTRGRIEQQIEKLRQLIRAEQVPDRQRETLLKKLDELSLELSQGRVSFAKVMAVLAHVGTGIAAGTTFFAEAPKAIGTIAQLLGVDKNAEEAEAARLGPSAKPKALPVPPRRQAPPASLSAALDDDIPF